MSTDDRVTDTLAARTDALAPGRACGALPAAVVASLIVARPTTPA